MKQTKMRRKALLSSIAMLLVAVVALSSATYAWFTANTAANVKGINLSTNATSDLKFSKTQTGTYTSDLNINITQTLRPCSTVDTQHFYVATPNNSVAVSDNNDTPVTKIEAAESTDYVSDNFYVMSGQSNMLYVTGLSTGSSNLDNALRVAVKVGSNDLKIFAPSDGGTTMQALDGATASGTTLSGVTYGTLYSGAAASSGVEMDTQTISSFGTAVTDSSHKIGTTATQISLWVWLEGNDGQCLDTMAGQTLTNLTINFSTSGS